MAAPHHHELHPYLSTGPVLSPNQDSLKDRGLLSSHFGPLSSLSALSQSWG